VPSGERLQESVPWLKKGWEGLSCGIDPGESL